MVGVQVAAADAGPDDAHERVGRLLQRRVGNVLDADVTGAVHQGGSHGCPPWQMVGGITATAVGERVEHALRRAGEVPAFELRVVVHRNTREQRHLFPAQALHPPAAAGSPRKGCFLCAISRTPTGALAGEGAVSAGRGRRSEGRLRRPGVRPR